MYECIMTLAPRKCVGDKRALAPNLVGRCMCVCVCVCVTSATEQARERAREKCRKRERGKSDCV